MEYKFGDIIQYKEIFVKGRGSSRASREWRIESLPDYKTGIIIGKRVVQDGYFDLADYYFVNTRFHQTYLVAELGNMRKNPIYIKIE